MLAELAQRGKVNQRHISLTDPQATIVGMGRSRLCYKTHRAVDVRAEVITATEVTRGEINEAHRLIALWQAHTHNTERVAGTVVADSKYGTIQNFLACHEQGIAAHMPDLRQASVERAKARMVFPDSQFPLRSSERHLSLPGRPNTQAQVLAQ